MHPEQGGEPPKSPFLWTSGILKADFTPFDSLTVGSQLSVPSVATGGELLLEPIAWPHDQEGYLFFLNCGKEFGQMDIAIGKFSSKVIILLAKETYELIVMSKS